MFADARFAYRALQNQLYAAGGLFAAGLNYKKIENIVFWRLIRFQPLFVILIFT
jgi:hypothetical protein